MANVAYTKNTGPKALPRGAELVVIGRSQYRVIWDLGDGLGYAWYTISADDLKRLYGGTRPKVAAALSNMGQFYSRYGNSYWGDVSEITLKAETPWDDLKSKVFNQFGYVPGLDTLEIKKLLMQAFYEGWTENQWTVEYRKTNYFNKLTDAQRTWAGQSEAERKQQIEEAKYELASRYKDIWGKDPALSTLNTAAQKIASGEWTMDKWSWDQRTAAAKVEGTPAWRDERAEEEAALEEGNQIEDLTNFAGEQWRTWVGPVDMPDTFAATWGANLASGKSSEADLENYLKQISTGRWSYKPPDVTWADWAASYKAQIRDELELLSLDDKDPLLTSILQTDMTGQDVVKTIRQDNRFRSTQKMYGELASSVSDMGRRFGFIT